MAKNVVDGIVVKGQTYNFVATDDNLATIETDATKASKAYAVGDHLILDGQYYVVTAAIAKNGSIIPNTNVQGNTVGSELTNIKKDVASLQSSFSQALTDLKNTAVAKAVGAVGTTFASVISKLGEIVDRGAWSANMTNTGSVTIPAGYHNGSGTVKTNGTASVTSNGTHNIAGYTSVTVNVQNDVKHSVTPYYKVTQDVYRHGWVGLIIDGVDYGAVEVGNHESLQNLQYNGTTRTV